jgi:DNA invertase Pin-like site-specific DNA recombinase
MPRGDTGRKRCAIYTRKSSEEGLEQEFNSLAAQCEACEAFIRSQRNEGWVLVRTRYDDGGFSGSASGVSRGFTRQRRSIRKRTAVPMVRRLAAGGGSLERTRL